MRIDMIVVRLVSVNTVGRSPSVYRRKLLGQLINLNVLARIPPLHLGQHRKNVRFQ